MNPGGALSDREQRLQEPRWFFDTLSVERVTRFLNACDLTPSQRVFLLDSNCWAVTSNGCLIRPRASVVRSLSPDARSRIYGVLSRCPVNYPQCHPFRFPTNRLEQCLASGGLSERSISRLRALIYPDADYLVLADLAVARDLLSASEFEKLVAILYQTPSYRLRLHVNADSDTEAVVRYWGQGGRTNLIRPLLMSSSRVPLGTWVGVTQLLPPFPRLRLYTFPEWWDDPTASEQDCFYSALNFFADPPDTNFLDRGAAASALKHNYAPVDGPPNYGDLVLLMDDSGTVFHAAVWLAGGFVFTKNGINPSQPWSLMKLQDLLLLYSGPKLAAHVTYGRRKSPG